MDHDLNIDMEVESPANDDYELWQSTIPFLYNSVATHENRWPSLTVEWLPDRVGSDGGDNLVQSVVLGTHAAENKPNYLIIAKVVLPLSNDLSDEAAFSGEVEIVQEIFHDREVNRARYMPQNYFTIATKTISSQVYLFDYRNHPYKPQLIRRCVPDLILRGHSDGGFGLSWSHFRPGFLLSGSHDANICLWDINGTPKDKALDAKQIYKVNEDAVEDVAWHSRHESLFGSCGDDRKLHIWDIRSPCLTAPVQSLVAHEMDINCLAFNPFNDWIVATGSIDTTIKFFDLRKFTAALYTLDSHRRGVNQIGWSPHHQEVLASCCYGNRVMVWDLKRINQRQTPSEAEGGPAELIFIHGGHTRGVEDLSWNPFEEWTVASVANDKMLQVWKLDKQIYQPTAKDNERARGG